ncbi:MAG: lipid-A-disaccharide synthase N-terminal domain-containing protein [Methyloligellaceae bacterium]
MLEIITGFFLNISNEIATWWARQTAYNLWWHAFGGVAQTLFFSRWLVQWFMSERAQKSVVPVVFWFLSFLGGLMMLIYVTHLGSPVLMIGQAVGLSVYARNIILINREKASEADDVVKVPAE